MEKNLKAPKLTNAKLSEREKENHLKYLISSVGSFVHDLLI